MAEANPSKGDSGRTADEQRAAGEKVAQQDLADREDYDKSRAEEVKSDSEDLGNGYTKSGGVVRAGQSGRQVTAFPGAEARGLDKEDTPDGRLVAAYVESIKDDAEPVGWTAQSGKSYVGDVFDQANLPGQTFSVEELPDPKVLQAAGVAYSIPAGLVVENNVTDNISASQERAGTQKVRGDSSRDSSTADTTSATAFKR